MTSRIDGWRILSVAMVVLASGCVEDPDLFPEPPGAEALVRAMDCPTDTVVTPDKPGAHWIDVSPRDSVGTYVVAKVSWVRSNPAVLTLESWTAQYQCAGAPSGSECMARYSTDEGKARLSQRIMLKGLVEGVSEVTGTSGIATCKAIVRVFHAP